MKKVLMSCAAVSILFFMVAMASAADKSTTVNGYVSDSMRRCQRRQREPCSLHDQVPGKGRERGNCYRW